MAFRGNPEPDEDDEEAELRLLGAIMEAEYQAVVVKGIELWFKVKKAEAEAAKKSQIKRPRFHRPRRRR